MAKSKFKYFVFFLIFTCFNLQGQEISFGSVNGVVLDSESAYPLIGATIIVSTQAEEYASVSDVSGSFRIEKIPTGRINISASYIGFDLVLLENILLTSGKEMNLEIEMQEALNALSEVTITANGRQQIAINDLVSTSNTVLNVDEVVQYAGSMQDVARMAQNFAGVSGVSDARNDVIVRGNSPSTVLWRMEGVDIPSPNHWATLGTSGGPVSMINTNMLRNSDFIAGAFPAEYGNSIGAVFDLKLRNGNTSKYEFLGQIGFNGFEGGVEGPITGLGENSSFIANYRYTTLGLVNKLGVNFGTGFAIPEYQDLSFKINVPTKRSGTFALWGMGGVSDIAFEAEPNDENFFTSGSENLNSGAKTAVLGAQHTFFFDSRLSTNTSLLFSRTNNETVREEILGEVSEMASFVETFISNNIQDKYSLNFNINYKQNKRSRIKAGLSYEYFNLDVVDKILLDDANWFRELDFVGSMQLLRGFAHWKYKISSKLSMNIGINNQYLFFNKSTSIEPRFALSYDLDDGRQLAFAIGKHSQLQPLPIYFSKDPSASIVANEANEALGFMKSLHYVMSYNQNFKNGISFKTEVYYQDLFSLATDPNDMDFNILNFGADFGFPNRVGLLSNGRGHNYGIEFTVNKRLKNGFYFLFTNSLFESKYIGKDKTIRNTYYNSNHVSNFLAGKEFKINKKMLFQVNGRFTYAGGRRYTPIDLDASIAAGREVRVTDKPFENRLGNYIRPDFKVGIIYSASKNYTHSFSVDFQNIINRENELIKTYDQSRERIRINRQRGFFPDVRYQILF